jgi:hypothetical protein
LEHVAFRIMAVADLGAFEFPFALDCIDGTAALLRRSGDIRDRECELDWGVFAAHGRRLDACQLRDTSRTITSWDGS